LWNVWWLVLPDDDPGVCAGEGQSPEELADVVDKDKQFLIVSSTGNCK